MSKMDRTKLPSTPCSNLLPLAPGSCDLSQAEKKLFCKAEQIQKMTLKIVMDEQNCYFQKNHVIQEPTEVS
jgi:hypothetical protein